MNKTFILKKEDIKDLAKGYGACFATDEITVKGRKITYMYREKPDHASDSGWRFFAGDETEEYIGDSKNISIYDVNTIANYDPTIIPVLDSVIGSNFNWDEESKKFILEN